MHPVGCLLGLAGGAEDRTWIVVQGLQQGGDIGRVVGPRMMGKSQIGEDVAGRQLRDQFLDGPGLVREPAGEVPVEPVLCTRGVGGLVSKCADKGDGVFKRPERWHEYPVKIDAIVGGVGGDFLQ